MAPTVELSPKKKTGFRRLLSPSIFTGEREKTNENASEVNTKLATPTTTSAQFSENRGQNRKSRANSLSPNPFRRSNVDTAIRVSFNDGSSKYSYSNCNGKSNIQPSKIPYRKSQPGSTPFRRNYKMKNDGKYASYDENNSSYTEVLSEVTKNENSLNFPGEASSPSISDCFLEQGTSFSNDEVCNRKNYYEKNESEHSLSRDKIFTGSPHASHLVRATFPQLGDNFQSGSLSQGVSYENTTLPSDLASDEKSSCISEESFDTPYGLETSAQNVQMDIRFSRYNYKFEKNSNGLIDVTNSLNGNWKTFDRNNINAFSSNINNYKWNKYVGRNERISTVAFCSESLSSSQEDTSINSLANSRTSTHSPSISDSLDSSKNSSHYVDYSTRESGNKNTAQNLSENQRVKNAYSSSLDSNSSHHATTFVRESENKNNTRSENELVNNLKNFIENQQIDTEKGSSLDSNPLYCATTFMGESGNKNKTRNLSEKERVNNLSNSNENQRVNNASDSSLDYNSSYSTKFIRETGNENNTQNLKARVTNVRNINECEKVNNSQNLNENQRVNNAFDSSLDSNSSVSSSSPILSYDQRSYINLGRSASFTDKRGNKGTAVPYSQFYTSTTDIQRMNGTYPMYQRTNTEVNMSEKNIEIKPSCTYKNRETKNVMTNSGIALRSAVTYANSKIRTNSNVTTSDKCVYAPIFKRGTLIPTDRSSPISSYANKKVSFSEGSQSSVYWHAKKDLSSNLPSKKNACHPVAQAEQNSPSSERNMYVNVRSTSLAIRKPNSSPVYGKLAKTNASFVQEALENLNKIQFSEEYNSSENANENGWSNKQSYQQDTVFGCKDEVEDGKKESRCGRRDDMRRHTLAHGERRTPIRSPGIATSAPTIHRSLDIQSWMGNQPQAYAHQQQQNNGMLADDDAGIMSEVETSSTGFRRGGNLRSSLPVIRTTSNTYDKPLGLVFLQFRNETKKSLLPNEITSLDTVKALFVRSFPRQLNMAYLDSPSVKIYIQDSMKKMFYELEEQGLHLNEIKDRCILRLYEASELGSVGAGGVPVQSWDQDQSYFSEPEFESEFQNQHIHRTKVNMGRGGKLPKLPPPPYYVNKQFARGMSATLPRGFGAGCSLQTNPNIDPQLKRDRLPPLPPQSINTYGRTLFDDSLFSQYSGRPHPITPIIDEENGEADLVEEAYGIAYSTIKASAAAANAASNAQYASIPSKPAMLKSAPQYDVTSIRVENMERQLANLTGLVKKALQTSTPSPPVVRQSSDKSLEKSVSFGETPPDDKMQKQHSPPPIDSVDKKPTKSAIKSFTLPRVTFQDRDKNNDKPPPMPKLQVFVNSHDTHLFHDIQTDMETYKHLRSVQRKTRELKQEILMLKRLTLAQTHVVKDSVREAGIKIRSLILVGEGNLCNANSESIKVRSEEDVYQQEMGGLEDDLIKLESTVEQLRNEVINKKMRVNMTDVENMALILSKSSKTVADLKIKFPTLRDSMQSLIEREKERIKAEELFLREHPVQLENALLRCKKLTGTLVTLKRLAVVHETRTIPESKLSSSSENSAAFIKAESLKEASINADVLLKQSKESSTNVDGIMKSSKESNPNVDAMWKSSNEASTSVEAVQKNLKDAIANVDVSKKNSKEGNTNVDVIRKNFKIEEKKNFFENKTNSKTDELKMLADVPKAQLSSSANVAEKKPSLPERWSTASSGKKVPPPPPPRTSSKSPVPSPTVPNAPRLPSPIRKCSLGSLTEVAEGNNAVSTSSSCESINSQDGVSRQELLEQRHQELLKKQKALQAQYSRLQQMQEPPTDLTQDLLQLKKSGSESNIAVKMNLSLCVAGSSNSMRAPKKVAFQQQQESARNSSPETKGRISVSKISKIYETEIL